MRRARQVQARFLPRPRPRLASVKCAGLTLPALAVGGDYYDFIRLSPRRLAVALADVSGKGVPAALMTACLQAGLRSHYELGARDLAARLESLNGLFHGCTASGHFVTLFLGEYDDRARRLRYANCGHVPPLVLRDDGSLEWLAPTAGVLGISAGWSCATAEVALEVGDTLVAYTDGVTEAMDAAGTLFGEQRLAALLRATRRAEPHVLLERVVDEVRRFGGGSIADDLTLVLVRPCRPVVAGRLSDETQRNTALWAGPRDRHADLRPPR